MFDMFRTIITSLHFVKPLLRKNEKSYQLIATSLIQKLPHAESQRNVINRGRIQTYVLKALMNIHHGGTEDSGERQIIQGRSLAYATNAPKCIHHRGHRGHRERQINWGKALAYAIKTF
jgi:hypothetical protein